MGGEKAALLFNEATIITDGDKLNFQLSAQRARQFEVFKKSVKNKSPQLKKGNYIMNKDTIEGNWTQLIGDIQKQWGKLTNDHLAQVQGSREKLAGAIQENYGIARDEAAKQISDWEKSYKKMTDNLFQKDKK
jgi:uncharacterized protein YjbJ (UPF0337 family)